MSVLSSVWSKYMEGVVISLCTCSVRAIVLVQACCSQEGSFLLQLRSSASVCFAVYTAQCGHRRPYSSLAPQVLFAVQHTPYSVGTGDHILPAGTFSGSLNFLQSMFPSELKPMLSSYDEWSQGRATEREGLSSNPHSTYPKRDCPGAGFQFFLASPGV